MRNVGIVGIGYTPVFVSKRKDVNISEMISEAVESGLRQLPALPLRT